MLIGGPAAEAHEHDHHRRWVDVLDATGAPVLDEHNQPVRRRSELGELCPVCTRHDHSDHTTFALEPSGHPIPAWWFNCPRCGDPFNAQAYVHSWTPEGLAFMRAYRTPTTEESAA